MIFSLPPAEDDCGYCYRRIVAELALYEPLEGVALLPVDEKTFLPSDSDNASAINVGVYYPIHGEITSCCMKPEFPWDLIIVPSHWVEYQLKVRGYDKVICIPPGIEPLEESADRIDDGRFVVATVGDFSLLNGHSIVVTAMREFMRRHNDCWLACNWDLQGQGVEETRSSASTDSTVTVPWSLEEFLKQQGIDCSRVLSPGLESRTRSQDLSAVADICLSPSMAPIGINKETASFLAKGTPVITLAEGMMPSGLNILALQHGIPVLSPDGTTVWFEPSLQEILEHLEQAYEGWRTHGREKHPVGRALRPWSVVAQEVNEVARSLQQSRFPKGSPQVSVATLNKRGSVFAEMDLYEYALKSHMRALSNNHLNAETYNCIGNLKDRQELFQEAILYFDKAIGLDQTFAIAVFNKANTLKRMNCLKEAIEAYQKAVSIDPSFVIGWLNLAIAHALNNELEKAEEHFKKTLELDALNTDALLLWGNQHLNTGRYDEALNFYRRIIAIDPHHFLAYNSTGIAYLSLLEPARAYDALISALRIKPDMTTAMTNLGTACRDMDKLDEAVMWFRRALTIEPDDADTHWNLALALLHQGDYLQGWREYEWRFEKSEKIIIPARELPLWKGEPLAGKTILLQAEQGYGDTIQFMRYAPVIASQGGKVIIECQDVNVKSVVRLIPGVSDVICQCDPQPDADFKIPLMSLPLLMGTTPESVPYAGGYITAPVERVAFWKEMLDSCVDPGSLRVGVVWDGRKTFRNAKRSVPLKELLPLFAVEGLTFVSLQKGEPSQQIEQLQISSPFIDVTAHLTDFADTAALIAGLDLVVSVDTSVAHLAGAVGCPTWVMLKTGPDWRWLEKRNDSPWYSSARLFRQTRDGVWDDVIGQIRRELINFKK